MRSDRVGVTGVTVSVAEDEPVVALELEGTLRAHGAGVLGPAATVVERLALLGREAPTAALVNARLRDGGALPLRRARRGPGVPIGLATGYGAGRPS